MRKNTIVILVILLTACKKEENEIIIPQGISAKIDGFLMNFTVNSFFYKDSTHLAISADGDSNFPNKTVSIQVTDSKKLQPGTYNGNDKIVIMYGPLAPDNYYNALPSTFNPAIVTIISIDNNSVKGTFKGELNENHIGMIGSGRKNITEGTFNIKR